jgi:hypothetical protein
MWIFTPDGFFSAVEHRDDPNKIMVRTRARMHAQRLIDALPEDVTKPGLVETPPPADYRFRVTVTREQWVYLVAKFAAEIAYPNFKNEASKRPHPVGFMSALHGVWSKLLGFQDDMYQDTNKGRWSSVSHGDKSSPFGDLDEWLSRNSRGNAGDLAGADADVEYVVPAEGMIVQIESDPDMGDGEVLSVNHDRGTCLVHFVTPVDGSDEPDEDVLVVDFADLLVLYDPMEELVEELVEEEDVVVVVEEMAPLSSRPEPDTYDTIEDLVAADDGSWPAPELTGFMRGA